MSENKRLFIISLIMVLLIGCHISREAYVNAHPELNSQIKEAILKGEVIEGMTEDEVRASWGTPYQFLQGTEGEFYYVYVKIGSRGTHSHEVVVFDKTGRVVSSGPR